MRMHNLAIPALILAAAAAAQSTPELMQFQFNEVRGMEAANTGSLGTLPATSPVNVAGWHTDPGRRGFRGNEAGYGCLGYRAAGQAWVNTGWPVSQTGSFTIMFWMRRDPASTSTNPFGYA